MTAALAVAPRAGLGSLEVAHRAEVARDVVLLDLVSPDRTPLPPWQPGAHIELVLPGPEGEGIVRQYSLCGDPGDPSTYRIAVLRVEDGRGGSAWVHEHLVEGAAVEVRGPHNHFPLEDAPEYVFVAGGIGITPILAMVRAAAAAGRRWRAVYLARDEERFALADELLAVGGTTVLWSTADQGLFDLAGLVADLTPGTHVYACGPESLLAALEALPGRDVAWGLHLERFSAAPVDDAADQAFEVVAGGRTHTVPAGCSILSVLRDAGLPVEFSCAEGVCGTCETGVLEGVPEHRDAVLTREEREAGDSMMICVSRARTPRLVLDL